MIRGDLAARLEQFKQLHPVDPAVQSRVSRPQVEFIGEEILDLAVSALLQGENILLSGGKATGKNILADNLAWLFARPVYNVSFHVNTDSGTLIGTDTFVDGQVQLRHGPVAQAARYGGFCVLDEINMAKTRPWLSSMRPWTTAGSSTCQGTTASPCTRPPASSPP